MRIGYKGGTWAKRGGGTRTSWLTKGRAGSAAATKPATLKARLTRQIAATGAATAHRDGLLVVASVGSPRMRIALSAVVLLIAGLTVALFAFAMARGKGRGRRGGGNGRSNRVGARRPQDDSAPSKTTPTGPRGRVPPPEHSPHNLTAIDASGRWRAELEALRRLGTSATRPCART